MQRMVRATVKGAPVPRGEAGEQAGEEAVAILAPVIPRAILATLTGEEAVAILALAIPHAAGATLAIRISPIQLTHPTAALPLRMSAPRTQISLRTPQLGRTY